MGIENKSEKSLQAPWTAKSGVKRTATCGRGQGSLTMRIFGIIFVLSLTVSLFPGTVSAQRKDADLRVVNPSKGTVLSYPVGLLYGEVADQNATEVQLVNPKIHTRKECVVGQAYRGRFKVLAPLRPGKNTLKVSCGDASTTWNLTYTPNGNPYKVRVIYMMDSGGNTRFQTLSDKASQDFRGKLGTAMKLMQTMTAERMNDLGYGRRTFNIELDDEGETVVHVLRGEKTAKEYYEDQSWFHTVYREVEKKFSMEKARYLVIPAYTRFDPETKKAYGHTALGGGGLAMFGGGTLYCWPDNIETAYYRMIDPTRIDGNRIMDDSVGRSTWWSCGATCIGASLHEIGHTFGLPHSTDPFDIMTRGHDHFYRPFLLREAPSAHTGFERWTDFKPHEAAWFGPPSASHLVVSRWFAQGDPSNRPRGAIEFKDDPGQKAIFVRSEFGIAVVQGHADGDIKFHMAPEPTDVVRNKFPKSAKIPYEKIRETIKGDTVIIRIYDANGDTYEHGDRKVKLVL